MTERSARRWNTRKTAALTAGALVVGLGATYTLASWNDSEWVWGGANTTPGVGTDVFEVQQNASSPFTEGTFADFENNPGNGLSFSAGALSLSPGDTTYAPVALRTTLTSVAGTVTLQGAVAATGITVNDTAGALWNAVRVDVYTDEGATPATACSTGFVSTGWTQIATNTSLATAATATQALSAAAGSTQHYCFALTLPAGSPDTLQGRTIAPAWEFASVSAP